MELTQTASKKNLAAYGELRRRVRGAIARGKGRAQAAVEREKVRTAWEVGKLIHEHILLNKARAEYGQRIITRLSADLRISETELGYMVQFAKTYPISRAPGKLSWSHYQSLLAVNDAERRSALAKRAAKEKWSLDKTRSEIKKLKAAGQITLREAYAEKPLTPLKGSLDTYRVVISPAGPSQGRPVIDLGFSNYYLPPGGLAGFKEGDILRVSKGKLALVKKATQWLLPLHTFSYRAYVLQVTDGDTLWVLIDLGFGFTTKQHLRLRGLDAPEITSPDGQRAKEFLERRLLSSPRRRASAPPILITSTRSDKYDRYLADVWAGERYINQELIDEGLAVRVSV